MSRSRLVCWSVALLVGCEQAREQKVLEIKTPGASIEVRKSADGAKIDVEKHTNSPAPN